MRKPSFTIRSTLIAVAVVAAALAIARRYQLYYGPVRWQEFSREKVDRAVEARMPVLITFSATWDPVTWMHEAAIADPGNRYLINSRGVVPLRADWTYHSPEVTTALHEFGSHTVPLTVMINSRNDNRWAILGGYADAKVMDGFIRNSLDLPEPSDARETSAVSVVNGKSTPRSP